MRLVFSGCRRSIGEALARKPRPAFGDGRAANDDGYWRRLCGARAELFSRSTPAAEQVKFGKAAAAKQLRPFHFWMTCHAASEFRAAAMRVDPRVDFAGEPGDVVFAELHGRGKRFVLDLPIEL